MKTALFPSKKLTRLNSSAGVSAKDERRDVAVAARSVIDEISPDFASLSVDPIPGVFGAYLAGPNEARNVTIGARYKL